MKIPNRRKSIKSLFFIICIAYFSVSCQKGKEVKTVQAIAKGVEIENQGYYFSETADIEIAGILYSLRSKVVYDGNREILKLSVYQPEGVIEYNKADLIKDKSLLTNYGYSFKNEFTFSNEKFCDVDGTEILIDKLDENILRVKTKNKVTFYYLN